MEKYRIRTRQKNNLFNTYHEDFDRTYYYVQYKMLGFWWNITTAFTTLKQAEEHITLKLKERQINGN